MPTSDNPADYASRGMMPSELLQHSLWWEGPSWLHLEPPEYPKQPLTPPSTLCEIKVTCLTAIPSPPQLWLEERYSLYKRLLRITAWIFRFRNNVKASRSKQTLTLSISLAVSEIQAAEIFLFARAQQRSFPEETSRLMSGKNLKTTSTILSLHPTIGSGGLLTVGGRLANSSLSPSKRHPIILHGKDLLTKLIVSSKHLSMLHAGPTLLMSALEVTLHITGALRLVRTICRSSRRWQL